MADERKLARFILSPAGEGFRLHIEDDGGHVLEITATRDQLDVLADALDDLLLTADSETAQARH
ncbi:MAG: hypothetical protein M3145_01425 [Pseudomonadota bacterium]|nr:hypothetical protein [Pseudomonadota bacterium]